MFLISSKKKTNKLYNRIFNNNSKLIKILTNNNSIKIYLNNNSIKIYLNNNSIKIYPNSNIIKIFPNKFYKMIIIKMYLLINKNF